MNFLTTKISIITKIISTTFIFAIVLTSCKKDKAVTSNEFSIEGKWSGNKGFDNEVPSNNLLITIKPGGVIEEINAAGLVKGSGTWTLEGVAFTAHYQFKAPLNTIYIFNGNYDKTTGKISGTWGFDEATNDGQFYLNRMLQ